MNLTYALRPTLAVVAATALTATLAACGSSDEDTAPASSDAVQVEHQFGTTDVGDVPERVVTLDTQWTDVMLAMGVEPVGYSVDSLMPDGGEPWREGDRTGEGIKLDDGVPVEQVAALEPDLIVGTYSITDKKTYEQLSGIAPTIAGEGGFGVAPWQELVSTAGDVLDEPDKAQKLIADVEGTIDAAAEKHPNLKGKTFALAQYLVGDSSLVAVSDENDGASVLFEKLGMTMLPQLRKEGEKQDMPRVTVSPERVDLLRSDFLAFLVNGGDESDLADIPGFDQLPASKSGAVAILDYATIVGLNTPSPLSIPYALDEIDPYLGKVA